MPDPICRECGEPIVGRLSRAVYCSVRCKDRRKGREHARRARGPVVVRALGCERCGVPFETQRSGQRFCSRSCQDAAKWARRVGSPEARELYNARARERYVPTGHPPGVPRSQPLVCVVEGCDGEPLARSKCKRHYVQERAAEGAPWAGPGGDRRRARRHGVEYEPISRPKVYERDGYVCGICSEPVPRDAVYPDPLSASLDHVVPLSLGGPHLYSNVQCAHLLCNNLKAANVAA